MRLLLAGDVMLGRSFNDLLLEDPTFNVWGNVKPYLKKGLFGVNLETTLTDSTQKWPQKAFNYRLSPQYASVLEPIGYCSLANNHILDYQTAGLKDTLRILDQRGISHAGAGLNLRAAMTPVVKENCVFLSAADHYSYWAAGERKPGIWYLDIEKGDYGPALEMVRHLRHEYPKKLQIFSLHCGGNWEPTVSPARQRFAYDLAHTGVDIIHGHSAHHIQKAEIIGESLIFYGMGDFLDDYAVNEEFHSNVAFLADITLRQDHIEEFTILPTKITDMQVNFAEDDADCEYVMETLQLG